MAQKHEAFYATSVPNTTTTVPTSHPNVTSPTSPRLTSRSRANFNYIVKCSPHDSAHFVVGGPDLRLFCIKHNATTQQSAIDKEFNHFPRSPPLGPALGPPAYGQSPVEHDLRVSMESTMTYSPLEPVERSIVLANVNNDVPQLRVL